MTKNLSCLLLSIFAVNSLSFAQDAQTPPQTSTLSASAAKTETATAALGASYRQFLEDLDQEKYVDAESRFETLIRVRCNDTFLNYARWQFNIRISQDRIKHDLARARRVDPLDPVPARLSGYISAITADDASALEHLNKAISLDPKNATAFYLRARCQRRADRLDSSNAFGGKKQAQTMLDDLDAAIRLDPTAPSFYLERAEVRFCLLRDKNGLEDIDAAMKHGCNPCEAYFQRGRLNVHLQKDRAAADDFTAAIAAYANQTKSTYELIDYNQLQNAGPSLFSINYVRDNTDPFLQATLPRSTGSILFDSYLARGVVRAHMLDLDNAIADLDAALKLRKNFEGDYYHARAEINTLKRDFPAALSDFNMAEEKSNDFAGRQRRAFVKLQLKDYRGAIDDCSKLIGSRSFGFSEARVYRGMAKYYLNDRDGALTDFSEAIKWSSYSSDLRLDALIGRGVIYLSSDIDLAIADFDEAVRYYPNSAKARFQRALAYHANKQYKEAIDDFENVISLEPDNTAAHFNLALTLRAAHQYPSAIASFSAAAWRDPQNFRSYYFRGLTKHDSGDDAAAISDYDQVLYIEPKYTNAYIQRAISEMRLNDFKAALSDYDVAIDLEGESLRAITGKSFLLSTCSDASLRNPTAASDVAKRASKIDADDPFVLNARACADAAAGDFTSAIDLEEKALKFERFAANNDLDGGQFALARIDLWKSNKLWTTPAPPR